MIRPLRRRHRFAFVLLAALLPLLFALGLLARQDVPRSEPLGFVTSAELGSSFDVLARVEHDDLALPLRTTWLGQPGSGQRAVTLRLRAEPDRPDLLVYWSEEPEHEGLPPDARLLGSIGSSAAASFVLPWTAGAPPGVLVLYSLAHQEIVARVPPPAAARGGGGP